MKDEPGEEAGTTDDLSAKPLVTFTPPPYPFISNEVLNVSYSSITTLSTMN